MSAMHLMHPTLVHFAVALFVTSVAAETLNLVTAKRFWGLVARYHLIAAAVCSFLAVLTGFIDYAYTWKTESSYITLKAHIFIGFLVFIIIQLMANYRFLMEKMLPSKYRMIYLIMGGLGVGLIFGTSLLGKNAVYVHGTGVMAAMKNYQQTEEYLKKLYHLESLADPTQKDSLYAMQYRPDYDSLKALQDSLVTVQPLDHDPGENIVVPEIRQVDREPGHEEPAGHH